jgi:hypothetical protein
LFSPRSHANPSLVLVQAAHALRARLTLARAQATHGWSPHEPDTALPSSQHSATSSSSADSVDTVLTAVSSGVMDDGLGLGLKVSDAALPRALHSSAPSPARPALVEPAHPGLGRLNSSSPSPSNAAFSTPSRSSGQEPNLYALVFGECGLPTPPESARRSKQGGERQQADPTTPTRPARVASSMTLYTLASSPQLGSSARLGGSGRLGPHWDPHNDPAPPHGRTRTPSVPHSPAHGRQRTITGGTLANGHAATPLAHGLGLARGAPGARPVVPPSLVAHARSASSTPQMRRASLVDTAEQRETDRQAARLLAAAHSHKSPALHTPPRAANGGGATTRANGTFADPNSITPRRARNSNAGLPDSATQMRARVATTEDFVSRLTYDESEAAQVLSSLHSSPSPQLASHSRFAGATPSLSSGDSRRGSLAAPRPSTARTLFEDELGKAPASGLAMHGLGLAPPADVDEKHGSPLRRGTLFPPSLEGEAAKLRLVDGRSPPITPPRSNLLPSRARLGSSASSRDAPSLDRTLSSDSGASSAPSSPSLAVRRTREPTTPPRQIASSPPTTPRAPGPKAVGSSNAAENAWLRAFTNVSPSPQPKMGEFSPYQPHTPAFGEQAHKRAVDSDDDEDSADAWPGQLRPVATPEQLRTPTRRSSARFAGLPPTPDLRELTASPMTPHGRLSRPAPHHDDGEVPARKRQRTFSRNKAL